MRRIMYVMALMAAVVLIGGGSAFAQTGTQPATWSVADCQSCHQTANSPAFTSTKHAQQDHSCANCHENVGEHAKAQMAGEKGPVPSLKALKASEINQKCLTCHEKANQANYVSSMHSRRNVACTQCHSVHDAKSVKAQLKMANDSDLCFSCHKSERAKSMRASHHPVREGKMSCTSCHNPHNGAQAKMIKADSINDLCYSCHTEKRGPYLYEHAPVREDCVSCHDAHGSNHSRLLLNKLPNLCWNCHLTGSGHFGSLDNLTTAQGGKAVVAPSGTTGYPVIGSRFVERSCRTCHVALHGSNHPSGAFFLR